MRIDAIVSYIFGHTLLDIGTDHAYVLIRSLQQANVEYGIGVDINEGPLKKAAKNVLKAGLEEKIKVYVSDGFSKVKDDYDIVSITGLGFETIKGILSQNHKTPNYYVISSHSKLYELRDYLSNSGFSIIDEKIVFDKKFYCVMKVIKEKRELSYEEKILGPSLMGKKESLPFYENELSKLFKIIKKIPKSKEHEIIPKKNAIESVILKLKMDG